MKKLFKMGIGLVLVLIAAVAIFASFFLNRTIKAGIETFGPELTKTSVHLDSVKISPLTGKGEIRGLVIGNPKGFNTDRAIRLNLVRINIAPASLLSSRIIINEILINDPEITYEMALTGSNIARLKKNISIETGSGGSDKKQKSSQAGNGPQIQINDLKITNGKIRLSAKLLLGKTVTVPLPDIHLKDIGKDEKGASLGEAVEKILAAVSENTTRAAGGSHKFIDQGLKSTGETISQGTESATRVLEKAGEEVKKGADKFFDGLQEAFK